MISARTIDEIFQAAQIEEVVEDFVQLKRRGSNMLGLCPFHNEKTPSFTVSPSKNIYKCFGCGRGGNPVQFIMEHEQMTYPEALRYLAQKYQIEVEETQLSSEQKEQQSQRESLLIANEYAKKYFEDQLHQSNMGRSVGLSYFKKRGYHESVVQKFGLGYSPDDGKSWTEYCQVQGIDRATSEALGLTTSKGFDFFRGRVMFPIHNIAGKVIAFAGRSLTNDKRSPKYINSPETLIYDKSQVLYGMHLAKKSIIDRDECILVEGYTDVISLHMQGIENVVASSGTALTQGQIKLIRRFTPQVLILYDGDSAGQRAAMRGIDLLLAQDMNVRIALLPEGKDPDAYVQEVGANGFRDFLENQAEDFVMFKSRAMLEDVRDNPIQRTKVIKELVSTIALIPDSIKRTLYIKEVATRFELDEHLLMASLGEKVQTERKKREKENRRSREDHTPVILKKVEESEVNKSDEYQERDILRILIGMGHNNFPGDEDYTVGQYIIANLEDLLDNEDVFDFPLFHLAIKEYARIFNLEGQVSTSDFTQHPNSDLSKLAVDLLSEKYTYSENWAQRYDIHLNTQETPELNFRPDCESALLRLKLRKINKLIEQNKEKLIRLDQDQSEDLDMQAKVALEIHSRLIYQRNQIARMLRQVVL